METPADNMKLAAAATMILCLAAAGCQSSINPSAAERISPVRLEYIEEFKRIDRAGKGRITDAIWLSLEMFPPKKITPAAWPARICSSNEDGTCSPE